MDPTNPVLQPRSPYRTALRTLLAMALVVLAGCLFIFWKYGGDDWAADRYAMFMEEGNYVAACDEAHIAAKWFLSQGNTDQHEGWLLVAKDACGRKTL